MPIDARAAAVLAATIGLGAASVACPAAQTGGVPEPIVPARQTATPLSPPDSRALFEGFTPAHLQRAVLAHVGEWKVTSDDAWRASEEGADWWVPFDVLVMEESVEAVRVVADRDDLFYAVYVRPEDLALLPTGRVVLLPAPDEEVDPAGPSVQLAGGAPIEVLERKDGYARIRVEQADVGAEGWVRESDVGRVYRKDDFNLADEVVDLEPAAATEVYDVPGGRLLATLRTAADAEVRVRALGAEREGWREILYPSALFFVRGFVRAERLTAVEAGTPSLRGHGASGYDANGTTWLDVPAGTSVLTGPQGEVFAYTYADAKLVLHAERPERGAEVGVHTIFGEATGWTACALPPAEAPLPEHVPCVPLPSSSPP
jgi:hypothetical protein